MSQLRQHNGVCHITLNPAESLILARHEEGLQVVLNESEMWGFAPDSIREVRVIAQEHISYRPSPHQTYLAKIFAEMGISKGSYVDIGAFDGLNDSHTYPLLKAGWRGLAVECQADRFARLAHVYRTASRAAMSRVQVAPHNVIPLLESHGLPADFDFLSLDIDSYDYDVLAALLAQYRPKVICAEINEVIPPPIRFKVHFQADFELDLGERFYGQSLAMLNDLAQEHGYTVVHMHYMDAFLIDQRYLRGTAPDLESLYAQGMRRQPRHAYYADYPFDVEKVLAAPPEEALALVKAGFAKHAGAFFSSLSPVTDQKPGLE